MNKCDYNRKNIGLLFVLSVQLRSPLCSTLWSKIKLSGRPWSHAHPCTEVLSIILCTLHASVFVQILAGLCMRMCLMCKKPTAQTIFVIMVSPHCAKWDMDAKEAKVKYLFVDHFSVLCWNDLPLFQVRIQKCGHTHTGGGGGQAQ